DRLEPDTDLYADLAVRRPDTFELRLPYPRRLRGAEPDLFELLGELSGEEIQDLLRLRRSGGPLDARVDVFRVLPKDDDVQSLGIPHRRRDASVPADRPHTHVKIEHLAQRDVQRANAAADRCRERALDADVVLAEGFDRVVGQPGIELLE